MHAWRANLSRRNCFLYFNIGSVTRKIDSRLSVVGNVRIIGPLAKKILVTAVQNVLRFTLRKRSWHPRGGFRYVRSHSLRSGLSHLWKESPSSIGVYGAFYTLYPLRRPIYCGGSSDRISECLRFRRVFVEPRRRIIGNGGQHSRTAALRRLTQRNSTKDTLPCATVGRHVTRWNSE